MHSDLPMMILKQLDQGPCTLSVLQERIEEAGEHANANTLLKELQVMYGFKTIYCEKVEKVGIVWRRRSEGEQVEPIKTPEVLTVKSATMRGTYAPKKTPEERSAIGKAAAAKRIANGGVRGKGKGLVAIDTDRGAIDPAAVADNGESCGKRNQMADLVISPEVQSIAIERLLEASPLSTPQELITEEVSIAMAEDIDAIMTGKKVPKIKDKLITVRPARGELEVQRIQGEIWIMETFSDKHNSDDERDQLIRIDQAELPALIAALEKL